MTELRTRKRIGVCTSIVWAIRNVLHSRLLEELQSRYEVVFIVPDHAVNSLRGAGVEDARIVAVQITSERRYEGFLRQVLEHIFELECPRPGNAVFTREIPSENLRKYIKRIIIGCFASVTRLLSLRKSLEKAYERRLAERLDRATLERIEGEIDIVLSTVSVGYFDQVVFAALKHSSETKRYAHILSFDNPTSRGYIPFGVFDHFLVWGEDMVRDFEKFHGIPNEKMTITGTPQFDFHFHVEKRFGESGSQGKGLLYTANHEIHTPSEPELVASIVERIRREEGLKNLPFKVRLHPMDRYERWSELESRFPDVEIDIPWAQGDGGISSWGNPTKQDVERLSESILESHAVMGIASTSLVDGVILRRPAIGIGFDAPNDEYSKKYRELHHTYHYKQLAAKFVNVVEDMESLIDLLMKAVNDEFDNLEQKAKDIEFVTGPLDGRSAERIARELENAIG